MVSINQSASSYGVRGHVSKASSNAAASVARLSSGHRITQSSEDVAGLAVGTTIQTGITSLRQAMRNAAQGTSLLQVADGALAQISDILQRQKTIATRANSGVLSNKERIYLNNEFQALTAQIDQIVGNTTFSGTRLLDGSLAERTLQAGSSDLEVNTNAGSSMGSVAIACILGAVPSNGDIVSFNDVEFEFTTAPLGSPAALGKVQIVSGSTTRTALNLAAAINASTDARLAGISASSGGAVLNMQSSNGSGRTMPMVAEAVHEAVFGTFSTLANMNGVPSGPDGLSMTRVRAYGSYGSDVLVPSGSSSIDYGIPLLTRSIYNNPDFIGPFGGEHIGSFSATYVSANTVNISLQVGGITYTSGNRIVSANSTITAVTMSSASGGSFSFNLRGAATAAGVVTSQAAADTWVARLNADFAGITVTQNRDITTYNPVYTPAIDGIPIAEMSGIKFDLETNDFLEMNLEWFDIIPSSETGADPVFKAVINGETYLSRDDLGDVFWTDPYSVADAYGNIIDYVLGTVVMQSETNPLRRFTMTASTIDHLGTQVTMDVSSDEKAAAVAAAIRAGFGLGDPVREDGTVIQIGASASELLGITIEDSSALLLYEADISVLTEENAALASEALDRAIATVTARRAAVGALQSRLDFTSGNLLTAIENQDAARGGILDTDFAGESTRYADAQVQLKMGVSLLAQVNKLPKDLMALLE